MFTVPNEGRYLVSCQVIANRILNIDRQVYVVPPTSTWGPCTTPHAHVGDPRPASNDRRATRAESVHTTSRICAAR